MSKLDTARNIVRTSGPEVKAAFVYGLKTAVVNTLAVSVTSTLNFYLESQGMNGRRITVTSVPNPDKGRPARNPFTHRAA